MTLADVMKTSFQVLCADVISIIRDGVEVNDADDNAEVIAIHNYSGYTGKYAGEIEIEIR